MRAVVQRTTGSQVAIKGMVKASIDKGLMVLLGIEKGDREEDARFLMDKLGGLRIFEDDQGKMNLSVKDVQGAILLVSQFTLCGDARKGRRPSFSTAEDPERAVLLFNYCVECLEKQGLKVKTGEFGAKMAITIENDGPCTILLDSRRLF